MFFGIRHWAGLVALVTMPAVAEPTTAAMPSEPMSLLTYNVKGLPWPVAGAAVRRWPGSRIGSARCREGSQPHLVALQEVFTPDAKAIGSEAGYRYVAFGPDRDKLATPTREADRTFRAAMFGHDRDGEMLSDHIGLTVAYRLSRAPAND